MPTHALQCLLSNSKRHSQQRIEIHTLHLFLVLQNEAYLPDVLFPHLLLLFLSWESAQTLPLLPHHSLRCRQSPATPYFRKCVYVLLVHLAGITLCNHVLNHRPHQRHRYLQHTILTRPAWYHGALRTVKCVSLLVVVRQALAQPSW